MTYADAIGNFLREAENKKEESYAKKKEEIQELRNKILELEERCKTEDSDFQKMREGAVAYHNFLEKQGVFGCVQSDDGPLKQDETIDKDVTNEELSPISYLNKNLPIEQNVKVMLPSEIVEGSEHKIIFPPFDINKYDENPDEVIGEYEDDQDVEPEGYVTIDEYNKTEHEPQQLEYESANYDRPSEPMLYPLKKNTVFEFDPDYGGYKEVSEGSPEWIEMHGYSECRYGNYENDGVPVGGNYSWDIKQPTPSRLVSEDIKRKREFHQRLHGQGVSTVLNSRSHNEIVDVGWRPKVSRSVIENLAKQNPDMFKAETVYDKHDGFNKNMVTFFGQSAWYAGEESDFALIKKMFDSKCFRINVKDYIYKTKQSPESFNMAWSRLSRTSAVPHCRFVLNCDEDGVFGNRYIKDIYVELQCVCDPNSEPSFKEVYTTLINNEI